MLPSLYTTVTISNSSAIVSFASAMMSSSFAVESGEMRGPALTSFVRHIWIGPASSTAQNDLAYGSMAWPVTFIHQIFYFCTSLRALALINLETTYWLRLEAKVPASVEYLSLGPIHGPITLRSMQCSKNLKSITSYDTYLPDWEVKELVIAPTLHRFRRFFSTSWSSRISFAFDQLPCLREARSLREMQIICCDEDANVAADHLKQVSEDYQEVCQDKRVILISQSNKWDEAPDGFRSLYEDWRREIALHLTGDR
ncbi:hypothetical protein OBBRIDRAFT_344533 [Obba rivulosa]|uniref:Uncharacterized protein n=1 Tax=Obba rivulosa TaxID=1052685 RepID=A0A8E2AIA3_9APHY|nr:hypothetical protein OBBRIDRAFT_344533 [Obba rivulosa]